MRAFVIGSKDLSCVILDALLKDGHEVLGVYARDDEAGMKVWHGLGQRNLAEEAAKHGIPVHLGMKVNSPESLQLLASLNLDLILSCFWSEIFKEPVLNLPKLGVYNFHTAKLPKNRGSRPLPWALIKGESEAGMTVHRMMTGVDNGPIVAQRSFAITENDTGETLYHKALEAGESLAAEVVALFARNEHRLILQDEDQASYQPRGEPYGRMIDPYWSEQMKDRFRRAFHFPPFSPATEAPGSLRQTPRVYLLVNTACKSNEDHAALKSLTLPVSCFSRSEEQTRQDNLEWHLLGPEQTSLNISLEKTPASRTFMYRLKQLLLNASTEQGLRPDLNNEEGIHGAYRPLDLLLRLKTAFVSSRMLPINHATAITPLQPHFHINGVLEIPSGVLDLKDSNWLQELSSLLDRAEQHRQTYGRDVFLGVYVAAEHLNDLLEHVAINEVFEQAHIEFTTYGEVCAHYHSIYTHS